jgi:hypothetical protein
VPVPPLAVVPYNVPFTLTRLPIGKAPSGLSVKRYNTFSTPLRVTL